MRETAHDASDDTAGDAVSFSHFFEPMICPNCHKEREQFVGNSCSSCHIAAKRGEEMDEQIRQIDEKNRKKAEAKRREMMFELRTEDEILGELRSLSRDFSDEARKREQELYAERRKVRILYE